MKQSPFDTEIKRVGREEELKFLKERLPALEKPAENLIVSCFPYTSPEKALEITDVLDKVSIRRGNIHGIERKRDRYESVVSQNLGIESYPGEALEFYSHYPERMDIVSNDFQGEFTKEVMRILQALAGRQVLSPKSIFLQNVFGMRESYQIKRHYSRAGINPTEDDQFDTSQFKLWLQHTHPELAEGFHFSSVFRDPTLFNLYREFRRDIGITRLTLYILHKGRGNLYVPEIFLQNPQFEQVNESYRQNFLQTLVRERGNTNFLLNLEERSSNDEVYVVQTDGKKVYLHELLREPFIDRRKLARREVDENFLEAIEYLLKQGYLLVFDEDEFYRMHRSILQGQVQQSGLDPEKVTEFLLIHSNKPYFLTGNRRYRYKAMHLDMYSLDQHEDFIDGYYGNFNIARRDEMLRFEVDERGYRTLDNTLTYLRRVSVNTLFTEPIPRELLRLPDGVK